jgi:hypothetical protein
MTDLSGPTRAQWSVLRRQRPIAEDNMATISISCDGTHPMIIMGVDASGDNHLLVEVCSDPPIDLPPDHVGLKVKKRLLDSGQFLDLCSPASYERVFTPFCHELADAVVNEQRDPWVAARTIIRAWQSAWKLPKATMDKSVQVGLYGELWVLENVLVPGLGGRAIELWSGPERERHDFVGRSLHIETKTTRRDRLEFTISRMDQLIAPAGKHLLLAAVRVEESIGGMETIADAIDRVRFLISDDCGTEDLFLGKLAALGWRDDLRRYGELIRLNLRDAFFFAVEGMFPRLPDDFCAPPGVVAIEYTIDLSNVSAMGVEEVQSATTAM